MTTDNWIAIAAIAATLIAPLIKVLLEKKIFREASEQEKKSEKQKRPKESKWSWQNILGWLLFVVPASTLTTEVLSSEPINRYSVFAISISVASLLFMAALHIFTNMIIRLLDVVAKSVVLHVKQLSLSEKLVKAYERDRVIKKKRLKTASSRRRR